MYLQIPSQRESTMSPEAKANGNSYETSDARRSEIDSGMQAKIKYVWLVKIIRAGP